MTCYTDRVPMHCDIPEPPRSMMGRSWKHRRRSRSSSSKPHSRSGKPSWPHSVLRPKSAARPTRRRTGSARWPRPTANRSRAASLRDGNQELIAANRVIEVLPALVEAAARGLADSNLTILNGTQGVSEVLTGLVGQGLSILDTLKRSAAISGNGASAESAVPTLARPKRAAIDADAQEPGAAR